MFWIGVLVGSFVGMFCGVLAMCAFIHAAKIDKQNEGKNRRILAYVKFLHGEGICSTQAVAAGCGISRGEVASWIKDEKGGEE